jgi:hypothetical protein
MEFQVQVAKQLLVLQPTTSVLLSRDGGLWSPARNSSLSVGAGAMPTTCIVAECTQRKSERACISDDMPLYDNTL